VILDANNTRAILSITTKVGAAATPPTPITVAPTALTLSCGASGSVTVVGGSGTYSAASASTRISAAVSGNTVTITRLVGDGATVVVPTPSTVTITDGASVGSVDVTSPPNCP
jgi:flagellar basal body rod protein FlgF